MTMHECEFCGSEQFVLLGSLSVHRTWVRCRACGMDSFFIADDDPFDFPELEAA